ncbi:MAG: hypothetical protein ABJA75_02445 [Bradyrhizobium sp.]
MWDAHANFPGHSERWQVGSAVSGLIGVMLLMLQTMCQRMRLDGTHLVWRAARLAQEMVNERSGRHCRELACFHRGRRRPMGKL